jgi:hypothetical protein
LKFFLIYKKFKSQRRSASNSKYLQALRNLEYTKRRRFYKRLIAFDNLLENKTFKGNKKKREYFTSMLKIASFSSQGEGEDCCLFIAFEYELE